MILYSAPKEGFLQDVSNNQIHSKILSEFKNKLGKSVGKSEVDSWRNSMQFMSQILLDPDIPLDSCVSIEFNIPGTGKRIDLILSGKSKHDEDVAVIIELKQWSTVQVTKKDAIVKTFLGGREVDVLHPSYQAWSYSALIYDYNVAVREDQIALIPCAYLHNLDDDTHIKDGRYLDHLEKAPCFTSIDSQSLREYLKQHVVFGDSGNIIQRIETAELRPSKSLADALVGMLEGNPEFVMIDDQKLVYETALELADDLHNEKHKVLIINGGPGTGKSVVAINLLVELTNQGRVAQYVSRNAAPRAVYSAKLSGTMRQTRINNLFKGSGSYIDSPTGAFDILIIDEAHRLNEKSGLYGNLGDHQIKEIIHASKFSIFFLDEDQQVTLKDVGSSKEIRKWAEFLGADVYETQLSSQFRCKGSDGYIAFLDNALGIRETANTTISSSEYDFRVFDDPEDLHSCIRELNKDSNKARMVAGYCWDWKSKKDSSAIDIEIGSYQARWNLTDDGSLWIIADESVEEVGCIHTCQGLEVDYIGVIVGPDFVIRDGQVVTDPKKRSRMDASVKGYIKLSNEEPEYARRVGDKIIKNTYRTLMTRGQKGCFVFSEDEETRKYFSSILS